MVKSLGVAVAAAIAITFVAAGLASAQAPEGFRTPSGNIACAYSPAYADQIAELRCDVMQMSNRRPPPPRDCELDYGDAFVLNATGRGRRICHGDTINDPSLPVLPYRTTWQRHGFTCVAQTTGVTCTNRSGHGISLARAMQGIF